MVSIDKTSLIVFTIIFNIIYPTFLFAFTSVAINTYEYSGKMNRDFFVTNGIFLQNAITNNLTLGNNVVFDFNSTKFKVNWDIDGLYIQWQNNPIDRLLDSWYFPTNLEVYNMNNVKMTIPGGVVLPPRILPVEWLTIGAIINNWDSTYSWTAGKVKPFEGSFFNTMIFLTYDSEEYSTISQSLNDGNVMISFAQLATNPVSTNPAEFGLWYLSIIMGSQSYGLPSFFTFLTDIMLILSILAVFWVIWG